MDYCSVLSLPLYAGLVATAACLILTSLVRIFKRRRADRCSEDNSTELVPLNGATKNVDDVFHSLHGLSICHPSKRRPSNIKSWLKTVEDMSYIRAEDNHDPTPHLLDKDPSLAEKPLSTGNGRRVLIRPARLRVRRCSISSATAALSLSDSRANGTHSNNGSHLSNGGNQLRIYSQEARFEPNHFNSINGNHLKNKVTHFNSFHKEPNKQPLLTVASQTGGCTGSTEQTSPSKSFHSVNTEGHWKPGWLVTLVIVASLSSNVLLFILLVFDFYKS